MKQLWYLFYHNFVETATPMSRTCMISGRGTAFGNSRSHSQIATRRKFRVNIQTKTIDGVRMKVSTRALRTLAKTTR